MRVILAILLLCAGAAQSSDMPPEVRFADLSDPTARQFDDPFRDMGAARLDELKTVVRLDERLSVVGLPADTRQRLTGLREAARERLSANGYDLEALLEQRWDVARLRMQARIATNPAFEGAEATLNGYLIPAGKNEDGQAIGYLVPVVGMCSHIPAPPPNQLVRLHVDPSMMTDSMYLPVRVSGTLRTEASDETIHILDGLVRMESLWRLDARSIVAEGPAVLAKTPGEPLDPLQMPSPVRSDISLN